MLLFEGWQSKESPMRKKPATEQILNMNLRTYEGAKKEVTLPSNSVDNLQNIVYLDCNSSFQ